MQMTEDINLLQAKMKMQNHLVYTSIRLRKTCYSSSL